VAAPTFRAAGTTSFTASNVQNPSTLTPGAPAGKASGDLLLLVCESRSITATVATPTGWTLLTGFPVRSGTASGGTIYVFARIADGSGNDTPSPAWSGLTTGTSGDASGATILAYSGVTNPGFVLDGAASSSDLSAQTTTTTVPAITTGLAQTLVVGVTMKLLESSGQTSTVSGRNERVDQSTTSGTGHIVEVCDTVLATAGTTGACTLTWSATTSARALTVSFGIAAVAPADTGLTVTDSIARIFNRAISVTGLTVTDSISKRVGPNIGLGGDTAIGASDWFGVTPNSSTTFGAATIQQQAAQPFVPMATMKVDTVVAWLQKFNSPVDGVQVQLQSDDGSGEPSGTVLANSNTTSAILGSLSQITFTFATPVTLTAGTKYWFVFQRTGTLNDTNNWGVAIDNPSTSEFGGFGIYDGASWGISSTRILLALSANDSIGLGGGPILRSITDTGLTVTDSLADQELFVRTVTDTGATVTDSLVDQEVFARAATDTGLTLSESVVSVRLAPRTTSVTGLTVSDSLAIVPQGTVFNRATADRGIGFVPVVFVPLG
jgi:hypothetical protein